MYRVLYISINVDFIITYFSHHAKCFFISLIDLVKNIVLTFWVFFFFRSYHVCLNYLVLFSAPCPCSTLNPFLPFCSFTGCLDSVIVTAQPCS